MIKERLWTRDFMALVLANGFLFAGFHFLLPTITLYAASLGATGGEIGLIGGIFGYSAICIRLFTDTGVHYLGKKKCLYLGLALSILATVSYYMFDSIHAILLVYFYSMTSAQQPCSLPRPPFPSWLSLPVSSVMPARKFVG